MSTARSLFLTSLLALAAAPFGTGCVAETELEESADEGPDQTDQALTSVEQSAVKRQSIGNCWLYATASWAEALSKSVDGKDVNLSESYWTYWHWFDQIARGRATASISTGGSYEVAREIIRNYGSMAEADFIPEEATAEMSARQSSALAAINTSLKSGVLSDAKKRADRAVVRAELDKAWNLSAPVVAQLNKVFGANVAKNLRSTGTSTTGTKVQRSSSLKVKYMLGTGKAKSTTLQTALTDWNTADYPYSQSGVRAWQKRVQRAMHDKNPVIVSWFVDFNGMSGGAFKSIPATPGRQGGHMTVLDDYEISAVPGFGKLVAGTDEKRPEALKAALDDKAVIEFFRVKNSWGAYRPDRGMVGGYNDLYWTYLDNPFYVKQTGGTAATAAQLSHCEEKADGTTDATRCTKSPGMTDVVLPPGY